MKCSRSIAAGLVLAALSVPTIADAQPTGSRLTLDAMVTPSSRFLKDDKPVTFALYGFIEFDTLDELFAYIDGQVNLWTFETTAAREAFAAKLLRKGVESRLVSMIYETPVELLLTHTARELSDAVSRVETSAAPAIFEGSHWRLTAAEYRDVLLLIQARWKSSLNCWSAAPSIPARVLSNWYLIEEGISLFGATYDSTEHFWQAVKYHPDITNGDVQALLKEFDSIDWDAWIGRLESDQQIYLSQTYAVEFLRANLTKEKRDWFAGQIGKYAADVPVRHLQQRPPTHPDGTHFTALGEKIIWGDLADLFHLVYIFSTMDDGAFETDDERPVLEALRARHFDGIYLPGRPTMRFISTEFQNLMLEIWKVKYLEMTRFGDVIRSTRGVRLDHFLNDGDSPDIPIPVYVRMLNEIRAMALAQHPSGAPPPPQP